ncbi:MAG: HD-GYP domain-containing protein [Planctomycetota bacterium]
MSAPSRTPSAAGGGAPSKPQGFQEININTLRLNSTLPFVLYTRIEGEHLIYRREDRPFTLVQRNALMASDLDLLYITADQIPLYWQYLRDNIEHIIDDTEIPLEDRSMVLYHSSGELTRRIVESPLTEEKIDTAQTVVTEVIRFNEGGKGGLHALMKGMATSPALYTHALHVSQYGLALAREIGVFDTSDLGAFGTGLLLQDLGMLQLPPSMILKEGPFSFDEWTLLKRHPSMGLEALESIPGVPEITRMVVFGHHERIDGSGYPQGLEGSEVPVMIRIAGIVDTFSGLTTSRPFRGAYSTYDALKLMTAEMGPTFDPDLLEMFIRLLGR